MQVHRHPLPRAAGQAVVQFAQGHHDEVEYAIKFFLDRDAFLAEAALYASHSHASHPAATPPVANTASGDKSSGQRQALSTGQMSARAAQFLPKVERLCNGTLGNLLDPLGRPLPPCIVMEKGESLQDYSERAGPDLFTSLAVRTCCPLRGFPAL